MFCRKCGKELPDGTKFCNFCGTSCEKNDPVLYSTINTIKFRNWDKSRLLIPVIAAVGILLLAMIWLLMGNAKKPEHVSESGDYTLRINDSYQFESTKSSIRFLDVSFGKLQYDSASNTLTAPVTFDLRVDIPGKKYKEAYADWLKDFSVNEVQAVNSVATYLPESDDCYLVYSASMTVFRQIKAIC